MIEILTVKAWALETRFFNRMAPHVLHRMAMGADLSGLVKKQQIKDPEVAAGDVYKVNKNLHFTRELGYVYLGDEPDSFISRNILSGVVSKNGDMCGYGTRQLGEKMLMADEKKNISAHIIEIDSPGGDVDGTPEFASIVAGLTKPVIAFVDGMAASAAYWIASQADHIVTNSLNYTQVGSIGTLIVLANESEYLKKEGIHVEIMRATRSVDKARLNPYEEWSEESLAEVQSRLDMINAGFIKGVNQGRNGKLVTLTEDIFTGKMYDQKKAFALGMIDEIGTLDQALISARKLAKNYKTTNKS